MSWSLGPCRAWQIVPDTIVGKGTRGRQKIWTWPSLTMRAVVKRLIKHPLVAVRMGCYSAVQTFWMFHTWNTAQRAGKPILPNTACKVREHAKAEPGSVFSLICSKHPGVIPPEVMLCCYDVSNACNALSPMPQAYEHVIIIVIKLRIYLPIFCVCVYIYTYICCCIATKFSVLLSSTCYTFDEAIKSLHCESGCCYWVLKLEQYLPLSSFLHLLICFCTPQYSIVSPFLQSTSDVLNCMKKRIFFSAMGHLTKWKE